MTTTSARLAALAGLLAATTAMAQARDLPDATGAIVQQLNYRSWSLDNSDAEGWQMVTPLDVTGTIALAKDQRLDLSLRTGFVVSQNETPRSRGRVESMTDTTVGTTYTIDVSEAVQIFATLDLNLESGRATLYGHEKNAVMDPDLVDMIRFGEGFNANASAGIICAIPDTAWSLTLAGGYNSRGDYVPDGDTRAAFDPGDQTVVLARVQYLKDTLYAALSVQYFDEDISTLAGLDYFDPGEQVEVNLEATYVLDEVQSMSAALFYTTSGRNAYLDFFENEFIEENVDGNGDYIFGQLAYSRVLTPELSMTLAGTYGARTENDYLPADDFFVPERSYWSVSLQASYALDPASAISASLSYGQVQDDETIFTQTERTYDTFTAGLAISHTL